MTANQTATTARETIKLLAEVQDIDDELADIQLERGNLPEELDKLTAKIFEFEVFITDKRAELVDAEHASTEHTHKLADVKEQLDKYQQQLYAVKTTREYDALTTEIETAKGHISHFEISIANNSNRKVELTTMLEERETELEELQRSKVAKEAELREKLASTADEEAELVAARDKLVARLVKGIFNHYERIRDSKGGRGVVRLTGGACGGCFAMIPPQKQVEIKQAKDIHACEACGRYLVPEDM